MQQLTAENIDTLVQELASHRTRWASSTQDERHRLLTQLREATHRVASRWVEVCCHIKGLDVRSARAGEEWAAGPMVVLRNLRLLQANLGRKPPRGKGPVRVFPAEPLDWLQWPGLWGHTWPAEKGLTPARGIVSLVLGAGNISSIAATDVIYKLFVEDQVVLLKMNPVHEALGPVLEEAFACLIEAGALRIVSGDAKAGAMACAHPGLEAIHITGSHKTYDLIVAGLTRPKEITAELGCVSPCLVVPGRWKERDIRYQARHVAGMLTTNAGYNCNAVQVLVTCRQWPQRQQFLDELRRVLAAVPPRKAYYHGSAERHATFCQEYPQAEQLTPPTEGCLPWTLIPNIDANGPQHAFEEEAFCGIVNEAPLDVSPADFLLAATDMVNTRLWGNLSCSLLIDPASMGSMPWREAVRSLRYGAVGINLWPGLVFALVNLPWGAYPGNTNENIQSGRGWVHNTAGVEFPEKAVLRGPFWTPFRPPWHAGHPRLRELGEVLTEYEYRPNLWSLLRAHYQVLRGSF